jgi:hypothetical protein
MCMHNLASPSRTLKHLELDGCLFGSCSLSFFSTLNRFIDRDDDDIREDRDTSPIYARSLDDASNVRAWEKWLFLFGLLGPDMVLACVPFVMG